MQKTYLIAGGSSGIGLALSLQLLEEGHKVIVMSRDRRALPLEIEHHVLDFNSTELNFPNIESEIDGLVYMPGSINLKPFKALKADDYLEDYRLNVIGAMEIIKHYLKQFNKEKASIVLMSTVAVQTGMPYHSLVASSKGAIEGMTRALAAELSPYVRVNAIAPSLTDTPLAEKLLNSPEKMEASKARHPMKSVGNSKHVAEWIKLLLSDSAEFMTGQIIHLDGGLSAIKKI